MINNNNNHFCFLFAISIAVGLTFEVVKKEVGSTLMFYYFLVFANVSVESKLIRGCRAEASPGTKGNRNHVSLSLDNSIWQNGRVYIAMVLGSNPSRGAVVFGLLELEGG